jgi:hypothetical protein
MALNRSPARIQVGKGRISRRFHTLQASRPPRRLARMVAVVGEGWMRSIKAGNGG